MITIRNRVQQICKIISAIVLLTFLTATNCCFANTIADDEKSLNVDYSKFNTEVTKNAADKFFKIAVSAESEEEKNINLENAAAQYYVLANINKSDPYPCVQLGRIYDLQGKDLYAKAYFGRALALENKNVDANYYFGEFYYTRGQYQKALEFYQKSLLYGKTADAELYKKIGHIYERFADVKRANFYYSAGLEINPNDPELKRKINKSAVKEYEQSGYYKRRSHN